MPNYDVHPEGDDTVGVRLYGESLEILDRRQQHDTEAHSAIAGSQPGVDAAGLEPGQLAFRGFWLGDDAETLATDFRDNISDDAAVTTVEVQAGENGSSVSSPYDGTYRIAEQTQVGQPVEGVAELWNYQLILIEQ